MAKRNDDGDETIDPMDVLARLTTALEAISNRGDVGADQNQALMARLTTALERVGEANIEGAKLVAAETRRAHRPSNEIAPGVSVFNRRGVLLKDYQKPKLKCIMLIPWLAEWESLTREEVELLNLMQAGDYILKRIDNSKVRVEVKVEYKTDGFTPSRLLLNHDTAFNNDNFKLMPPMSDMLRQVLKQHSKETAGMAAAVLTDEEEEALIEAGELSVSA